VEAHLLFAYLDLILNEKKTFQFYVAH